jgi:GT2 family glycosyltransferase
VAAPSVEVVIPVYNGLQTLPGCLDAVLRQTLAPEAVWVVDNGSTDGTYEWLQERQRMEPRLRVLRELRRGQAAARNAALRLVEAEVVAFTDADCVPETTWLEQLLPPYADPGVGAVAGAVLGHEPRNPVERYLSVAGFPTPPEPRLVDAYAFPTVAFYTANLSARSRVLRDLGGFDPAMPPADDLDLCARTLTAGWKMAYTPEARVRHVHRSRAWAMLRRLYEYGASRPKLLRKNCPGLLYTLAGRRWWTWKGGPTGCLNLTSPEKVCFGLACLSLWSAWFLVPLGLYVGRLATRLTRAARERGVVPRSPWEVAAWTALHVAEFAAVNLGSLVASARYRVICF